MNTAENLIVYFLIVLFFHSCEHSPSDATFTEEVREKLTTSKCEQVKFSTGGTDSTRLSLDGETLFSINDGFVKSYQLEGSIAVDSTGLPQERLRTIATSIDEVAIISFKRRHPDSLSHDEVRISIYDRELNLVLVKTFFVPLPEKNSLSRLSVY